MAKLNYEHVYAAGGISGESWDVSVGYNQTFTPASGDAAFAATGKTITLTAGTWPTWLVVGKVFTISGTTLNNGTFSVESVVSNKIITVRETVADEAAQTPVLDGSADVQIQDVLLNTGNGALTADCPLVLTSTGALGAPRTLDISALEAESALEGSQALRGRLVILSVQNTDILTNSLTLNSSSTINGAANLVIDTLGEYFLYHVANGVWRATILPTPADALATIARITFTAADWDAGTNPDTIKIIQTGAPAAGEVGPHGLTAAGSYMVQIINTDLTPDEQVDVEIQFASNGDITLVKAPRALDFNGVAVIIGSLD